MCVKINLRNSKGNRIRKMNADAESKLHKGKHSSKRTTNLKSKDDHMNITWKRKGTNLGGSGGFQSVNSGQKRKRVFAEQYDGSTRRADDLEDVYKAKALSRNGESKHKENFIKEKRKTTRGSQDIGQSNRQNSMIRRVKSTENDLPSKKGNTNLRAKMKKVDGVSNVDQHGNPNGMLKKGGNIKSNMPKLMTEKRSKFAVEFPEKSLKKKVQEKKSMADKSKLIEDRPKKKKRVIRIDPNDTSNKRLSDGMVENDKTKKEDNLEKENVEMSKNAQFRAIQPSPSILSFVDDNLLGRRREIELRRAGYNTDLSAPLDNIPFSTSSERERTEESIFRNKLTFFAAAKVSSSFPPPGLLEIAFAGRSNVGKSSLLNSLTRQWGVVRTSDKPGLTQTINFFKLGSNACLVDLPGYGFAYAKEEVKEAWQELVKEYVSTRVGLKRVCLLVDTKWGMKPRDHELVDLMERSQTKYQIILTKTDLVFPIDVARRAMQIEESLKANKSVVQPLMMASSKSGAGIGSLRTVLAKIARFAKP